MRLLDLTLQRVRRHRELQLAFSPGLTPVGGTHESGKSTLVEALHKGLFLKATATGRGVEIGLEAAGQRWTLRKRFSGSSGTCQLSHGGGLNLSGAAAASCRWARGCGCASVPAGTAPPSRHMPSGRPASRPWPGSWSSWG